MDFPQYLQQSSRAVGTDDVSVGLDFRPFAVYMNDMHDSSRRMMFSQ